MRPVFPSRSWGHRGILPSWTPKPTVELRSRWHQPKVVRALLGLVFVVGVFVVAPVVAMLLAAR
jgi:hypothetical protein